MNRPPSFQFYPKDWLDFKVQRMSLSAQGAYLKILCYMWNDSKDQCSITDNDELIASCLGTSVETWRRLRVEIQNESDPILIAENGCLVSRRLKAEASKQRKYRRLQALKGTLSVQRRLNRGSTAVEPEHQPDANSSSSSSSSTSNKKEKELSLELAAFLRGAIHTRDPAARAGKTDNLATWADDIELLVRVDERTPEEVRAVIAWCQSPGCFWGPSVLSGKKLRALFDTLAGQMKWNRRPPNGHKPDTVGASDPSEPEMLPEWREQAIREQAEQRQKRDALHAQGILAKPEKERTRDDRNWIAAYQRNVADEERAREPV